MILDVLWHLLYGPEAEPNVTEQRQLKLRVLLAERELKMLQRAKDNHQQ